METSQEYLKALEQVRHMPQGTETETAEKREQAKLLRMRIMFDNARCAELLTKYEQEHPFATEEGIETMLEREGTLDAYPEAIRNFMLMLKANKLAALDALNELKREDGTYETDRLFQWIVKDPRISKPIGTLEIDSRYPFALILYVNNQRDFQRIDPRKNVGGFYQSDVFPPEDQSQKDASRLFPLQFPLIVIRGSRHPIDIMLTGRHEIGHSHNQMFKDSETPRYLFWGEKQYLQLIDIPTLRKAWKKDPASSRETSEWKDALSYVYSRAKDELLADYFATKGNFLRVPRLLKQGGIYDYVSGHLKISPSSDLYHALWDEYRSTLESATKSVSHVTRPTISLGLNKRTRAFRWVLGQIPLDQWERQLEGTLFQEEANALATLSSPDNRNSNEGKQCIATLRGHPYEPLLPYLNDYRKGEK